MALNILIVDDSSVMRRVIRRCVELADLPLGEIHEGHNGQEGLDIVNQAWVDIVITDINMPVMDGIEMISLLRREPATRSLPVVVVSTEGSEARVSRLESEGVTFVHKPFRPEALRETLLRVTSAAPAVGLNDTLARTAERVFADLAYVFAVGADEIPPAPDTWATRASVRFSGPSEGRLVLAASHELMTAVASNMLAVDDGSPVGVERERDALGELASVICGNLVTSLGNPQAVFRLHAPELRGPDDTAPVAAGNDDRSTAHVSLTLDAGHAELWLVLEPTPRGEA